MTTIHKYTLDPRQPNIWLPEGAEILGVQVQHDQPCLWAKVDTSKPKRHRRIAIYGTGHEMTGLDSHYIGTFQLQDGALVFHVFEEKI